MTVITMKDVKSSSVSRIGYDPTHQVLAIHFKGTNKTYHYQDVPPEIAEGLDKAASVGSYIGQHIRGKFPHVSHEA